VAREAGVVRSEDEIDESLRESFPASDPPAWIALVGTGSPKSGEPSMRQAKVRRWKRRLILP
jgi:hypothetical protein